MYKELRNHYFDGKYKISFVLRIKEILRFNVGCLIAVYCWRLCMFSFLAFADINVVIKKIKCHQLSQKCVTFIYANLSKNIFICVFLSFHSYTFNSKNAKIAPKITVLYAKRQQYHPLNIEYWKHTYLQTKISFYIFWKMQRHKIDSKANAFCQWNWKRMRMKSVVGKTTMMVFLFVYIKGKIGNVMQNKNQ